MTTAIYRVESTHPIVGPLWAGLASAKFHLIIDRTLAIVLAAKSRTLPSGHEIRVVHVPSGKVVFRKTDGTLTTSGDD